MTAVETGVAARHAPTRRASASGRLVRSSLQAPVSPTYHLLRARLSGLLDSTRAPLALLSAPAGAGKSALAAEWAHRLEGAREVVWIGCHGDDVDPWVDVVQAMRGGDVPDPVPRGSRARGSQRRGAHPRNRVEQVLESAGRSPLPWTIFLDGYDLRSVSAAEELDLLLTYAGEDVQVVLTTRSDPVLPLHRYRLHDNLLEVRASDLAFSDLEAESLLRAAGVDLDRDDLHALNERLTGWAAGLRFALPTLATHPSPRALVSSALTYNGNINAFLVEEVLDAQPPAVRDLILTSSVPDTLPPALLEELTGEPAALTARRLISANVFLESARGDESCLRYMPFFRDLVRAQLAYEEPDRLHRLHRTAAGWYAAHGGWEGAVTHMQRAGDRPDFGALLVDHLLVGRLLCERRDGPVRRLFSGTTSSAVTGPGWHLLRAATALAEGDHAGCSGHLDAARGTRAESDRTGVTIAVLDAVLAAAAADGGHAERLAVRAEEALVAVSRPVDHGAEDTLAVLLLVRAAAAVRVGAVERAGRLLEAALASPTSTWSTAYRCRCLALSSLLHARAGAMTCAAAEAEEAVAAAHLGTEATALSTIAHLVRANVALATGDLAGARTSLSETCSHAEPLWEVVRALVAAALERAAGAFEQAATHLDAAAGAAELAGPWLTDWVRQERAAAQTDLGGSRDEHVWVETGSIPEQREPERWTIGSDGRVVEPLTPREIEVLTAMSEWLTTEEIAQKLFVSINTVRTHVRNILTKLGVSRRNAAIREALRLGLLPPGTHAAMAPSPVGPS